MYCDGLMSRSATESNLDLFVAGLPLIHAAIAGSLRMSALMLRGSAELQQVNQASQAATSAFKEIPG